MSVLDQLTLADFIACGQYDRHIRRMRQRYRGRRDQLVSALAERPRTSRSPVSRLACTRCFGSRPARRASVVKAAAWQGIALDGLSEFRRPRATVPTGDGLVIGCATPAEHAYRAALEALLRALPTADACALFQGEVRARRQDGTTAVTEAGSRHCCVRHTGSLRRRTPGSPARPIG